MEIAVLVLSILVTVLLFVVLFVLIKKKSVSTNENESKEIGRLEKMIENQESTMKTNITLAMKDVLLEVKDHMNKNSEANNEKLERFQNNINKQMGEKFDGLNKQVDTKLNDINKKVEDKLAEGYKKTDETMASLRERLQKIDDAQKNLEGLSGDVISLKKVLEGNQSRGRYGEYKLSSILHAVFGDTKGLYEEQFTIKEGKNGGEDVRADAVVFTKGPSEFICIDSKFPFADYLKMQDAKEDEEREKCRKEFVNAVKKHITDIKNKYIVPPKSTAQALMFIPNDGVFAFIHHECGEVIDYAHEKDVIITSPSTLQAILATLQMLRLNYERSQKVEEISKQLKRLGNDFKQFSTDWDKLSTHLSLATKDRERLDSRVFSLTNRFDQIKENNVEEEDKQLLE